MKILAIDTSSPVASAAVMSDGVLVGEYTINNGKTHSQIIVPLISDMLKKSGLSIGDIDVFATSLGPGSFTGLRIGVATAKSFAQALGKPIIGISALKGLAVGVDWCKNINVCPIMDARRGNVYNAVYKNGVSIKEDRLISLDCLIDEIDKEKTVFLGDGVFKHKDKISAFMGENAIFLPENLCMQRASSIAYLAYERALETDYDDVYSLEPIYVRASQAERELAGETE